MKLSRLSKLSFLSLMVGVLSAGSIALTGCDPQSSPQSPTDDPQTQVESSPDESPDPTETPISQVAPNGDTDAETPTPAPKANAETMKVEVYHADNQCEELVSESMDISQSNALEVAVGNIIEDTKTAEFEIAGYQVNVDENTGVATIDMRLDPDSRRQFVSLSSCEKFALFGSLNETLTANEQWNIQEVRFTESGEEILF